MASGPVSPAPLKLPVRVTYCAPPGPVTCTSAQPKKPSRAGAIQFASRVTWSRCQSPPRYTEAKAPHARRTSANIRFVATLASSPLAAQERLIRSWSTWPTWYTSAVCAEPHGTGDPCHGSCPRATAGCTAQQVPAFGACAGGLVGIGALRLIHHTRPTAVRPSTPIAASRLPHERAMLPRPLASRRSDARPYLVATLLGPDRAAPLPLTPSVPARASLTGRLRLSWALRRAGP